MTFQAARNNEIIKLEEAIARYYAQGIDPPHYLTSQLADLDPSQTFNSNGNGTSEKTRFTFTDFTDTWDISTSTISYPQIVVMVTEMRGYTLTSPLFNVTTETEIKQDGAVVKFFAASQPVEVKGYAIAS